MNNFTFGVVFIFSNSPNDELTPLFKNEQQHFSSQACTGELCLDADVIL